MNNKKELIIDGNQKIFNKIYFAQWHRTMVFIMIKLITIMY